jgi:hypothetical protein
MERHRMYSSSHSPPFPPFPTLSLGVSGPLLRVSPLPPRLLRWEAMNGFGVTGSIIRQADRAPGDCPPRPQCTQAAPGHRHRSGTRCRRISRSWADAGVVSGRWWRLVRRGSAAAPPDSPQVRPAARSSCALPPPNDFDHLPGRLQELCVAKYRHAGPVKFIVMLAAEPARPASQAGPNEQRLVLKLRGLGRVADAPHQVENLRRLPSVQFFSLAPALCK